MMHRAGLAIWSQTAIEGLWAACYGDPMDQPLFDLNLKRVTREHYITGKAVINFPSNDDTGGWHFLSHSDEQSLNGGGVLQVPGIRGCCTESQVCGFASDFDQRHSIRNGPKWALHHGYQAAWRDSAC